MENNTSTINSDEMQTNLVRICSQCGNPLKDGAVYCGKCRAKVLGNETISTGNSKRILWIHTLLTIVYLLYQIYQFIDQAYYIHDSSDPFLALGNMLLLGLAINMMKPHLFLMAVSAVFSTVGLFMKKPWPYLTAAIIQTIATIMIIAILFSSVVLLIICIATIVLGFMAYSRLKKGLI
ncbi:MAG: zinc ribbon domain-containing protein [Clostridia bacterium]|nr:zinc ribbon domain-containing protein [Clostridia bacterium]